jgi:D-alanyl-D-alanine carboxypeptidase/D-alanyl-D-alanine-endopeptidase (penicillin-binding protein 4)
MKKMLTSLFVCLIGPSAFATSIQGTMDQLINNVDPAINMSAIVVDLNTGETLFQRNPTKLLVPASNMKLFSDAAALLALGPDYRFKSQLTTNASMMENGVLKGSLYLHLPGDPSFTQENLDTLLAPLAVWGVKRIEGNVVLVSNNASVPAYAPGRMASDNKYSYGAPVAPVVFDENRLMVTVNPSHEVGTPAIIELGHLDNNLSINNQVITSANNKTCGLDFNLNDDNQLTVRGCIGVGQWAVQQLIPIRNPLRYAQDLIKYRLSHLGIKLDGEVNLGASPSSSLLLSSHASKPITQLMADTLKPSDNLYADSLFLHAAAKLYGHPLAWEEAQPMVKAFLQQQTGIDLKNAVLIDGSGLSRNNLISAQQTVDLLRFLHNHFPLAYEYIAALPIAGQDGTLRRRFRKPTEQGLLRAKTGTMTGVMSLSGYLYSANAHTLAFGIFINKTPGTKPAVSGRYKSLVDSLCDFLLRQKPNNHQMAESVGTHTRVAYQQQPSQGDRQGARYAKWRQLESAIKGALQGQSVTVLFRGDQLILKDSIADINKVWSALKTLQKKYSFSIALNSPSSPTTNNSDPWFLWVKTNASNNSMARTWTLLESVS